MLINRQKLTKSRNKLLAGCLAGIAEYLGWDITILRIAYALFSIFSAAFPGIIFYIMLCIIMPNPDSDSF